MANWKKTSFSFFHFIFFIFFLFYMFSHFSLFLRYFIFPTIQYLSPSPLVIHIMNIDYIVYGIRFWLVILPPPSLPDHCIPKHLRRRVLPSFILFTCRQSFRNRTRNSGGRQIKRLIRRRPLIRCRHHISGVYFIIDFGRLNRVCFTFCLIPLAHWAF